MSKIGNRSLVPNPDSRKEFLLPVVLVLFTLISRLSYHGSLYYGDGPNQIKSILLKLYIIQPPGYWLFNRLAGVFPNPTQAISAMNIIFSIAGVLVFYYAALFFTRRRDAFIAALAYSSIYFVWFSGEIDSTYASQACFPIATFYLLLRYERDKSSWLLWLAAAVFTLGAGLRPSDGAFLIPMLVYFSVIRLPHKKAYYFFIFIAVFCLAWIIPTAIAFQQGGWRDFSRGKVVHEGVMAYMRRIMERRSIVRGINAGSMANVVRYFLPVTAAFWPVLPASFLCVIRRWKDWRIRMILFWIVPGSAFFILSSMGGAPYLTFLSAAILLLALGSPRMMAVTAVWNIVLFLGFTPIQRRNLVVDVLNCYIGEDTNYGIRHQWQPLLSSVDKLNSKQHE